MRTQAISPQIIRVAVDNGFVGTEEEWLESLVGPEGPRGRQGADGEPGPAGVTSAEVTVDDTTGTPSAQISVNNGLLSLSLSGIKGETGPQGEQGIQGVQGPQGVQGETGPQGETGATGPAGPGVPTGGTAGQVLTKTGAADYAAAWQDPSGGDVTADMLGIVINGNSTPVGASVGQYVIVKNSTITGITDGLYKAAQAIPANTAIDSTYLTTASNGGLNDLLSRAQWARIWTNASPNSSFAGQDVAVPGMAGFDEYRIQLSDYMTATAPSFQIVIAGYGRGEQWCFNAAKFHYRTIITTASGVTFRDSNTFSTYGSAAAEVTNSYLNMVPDYFIRKQTLANCERYFTEELKDIETKLLSVEESLKAALEQLHGKLDTVINEYHQSTTDCVNLMLRYGYRKIAFFSERIRSVMPRIQRRDSFFAVFSGRRAFTFSAMRRWNIQNFSPQSAGAVPAYARHFSHRHQDVPSFCPSSTISAPSSISATMKSTRSCSTSAKA